MDIIESRKPFMSIKSLLPITKNINIIVGGFGSGKSEIAVNLARHLVLNRVDEKESVAIVDLDIINPYFRSREAAEELEKLGITTINPKGAQFHADLPIVLPEIKGIIQNNQGKVILDVGGDDVGARVLSSLAEAFQDDNYELMLVLNISRPFTSTVDGCINMIKEIEVSSRLKFTGIISNTHLMEDTTEEIILEGLTVSKIVSKQTKIPLMFLCATEKSLENVDMNYIDVPVLPLNRSLLKPWEQK